MMKRLLFIPLLLMLLSPVSRAEELDAQVGINISALSVTERQNMETFKADVERYINNYEWTNSFTGDRIRCTFQFNIMSSNGGVYTAQLFVTSTRPMYKSDQVTTMARFFDPGVEFSYYRGQELQHGNNYRSLESVIDYYVYIVLGLDFDSFKAQSGTLYFQQAQQDAIVASAAKGSGWERNVTSIGTCSRMGYIDDAMSANNR